MTLTFTSKIGGSAEGVPGGRATTPRTARRA